MADDFVHLQSRGDEWVPLVDLLPDKKVSEPRMADFKRLAQLQDTLRASCTCMLEFTRRRFDRIAEVAPDLATACNGLQSSKLLDLGHYVQGMEKLVERIEEREKLRVIFIGPLKAGKSSLINLLLSTQLKDFEMLLPVDNKAATNCIWKVESCIGRSASVSLGNVVQRQWPLDDLAADVIRADIATFLEDHFARDVNPLQNGEILVQLPLDLLDPFGCHYSLVDTPGFTESAAYEELVRKFLQDHSHIACMVCPLTEGTAVPQQTQNMLKLNSYSKTFWVLTRFDLAMTFKPAQKQRGMSKRQAADSLVSKFRRDIGNSGGRIFLQAGGLLSDPEDDVNQALMKHLPLEEAKSWLKDIQHHVKDIFMAMQQEQTVLTSQSVQAMHRTAEVMDEYRKRLNSSQGTVAASDFYAQEMQTAAEDAAADLEREIRKDIETVCGDMLLEMCTAAGEEVYSHGGHAIWVRHKYMEALLAVLVPKIEHELQTRLDAANMRAQEKTLRVALRLLREAGLDDWRPESASHNEVVAPNTGHLRSKYPVESVTMLSVTALSVGRLAATEAGVAALSTLGVTASTLQLAGVVGMAIGGIALLGLGTKYALEAHPFWTRTSAHAEMAEDIRKANHWNVVCQMAFTRGKTQLLSQAARLRYKFSELLLTNSTSTDVLHSLFPDFSLLEQVKAKLSSCCLDIEQFMEAEQTAESALRDLSTCSRKMFEKAWMSIVDVTTRYVEDNSRTDVVDGRVLASLLALRTEALVKNHMLREAKHTLGIFRKLFPDLTLPLVYDVAADVLLGLLEGNEDTEQMITRVRFCNEELKQQCGNREIPLVVEIWYLCVVSSFLPRDRDDIGSKQMLMDAIDHFVTLQVQHEPKYDDAIQNSTILRDVLDDPNAQQAAIDKTFADLCKKFVGSVLNSVRELFEALPVQDLDLQTVGRPLLKRLLDTLHAHLCQEIFVDFRFQLAEGSWMEDSDLDDWKPFIQEVSSTPPELE